MSIITVGSSTASARRLSQVSRIATVVLLSCFGSAAAVFYSFTGQALLHYDARAHVVVARRVIDSLTPGWQQIGAVWLPLPHLLNLLPVQLDMLYRTGAFAIGLSVVGYVMGGMALFLIVQHATGSLAPALAALAIFALNPSVLYLQSTPMTEMLLVGLIMWATWALYRSVSSPGWPQLVQRVLSDGYPHRGQGLIELPRAATLGLAAACWVRYEAWTITAGLVFAMVLTTWRAGLPPGSALRVGMKLCAYPLVAVLVFVLHSRVTTGVWLTTGGFYVPDNPVQGRPWLTLVQLWWGLRELTGPLTVRVAGTCAVLVLAVALLDRQRMGWLLILGPVSAALVPFCAFLQGHPYRVRYMVPLVPVAAALIGLSSGVWRPLRRSLPGIVAVVLVLEAYLMSSSPMMLREARLDVANHIGRMGVTEYLLRDYDRTKILLSMASLAHYAHELGQVGFPLREFVHEGNGVIWSAALMAPRVHVGWILIESRAEGGDMLAARQRVDPDFTSGFRRVATGGGVELYKRLPDACELK